MKYFLSILLLLVLETSFGQSFNLLNTDEMITWGGYTKQVGNKLTIYDNQNASHFRVESNSPVNNEYVIIRNSLDTTIIQSVFEEFSSLQDSTYFVVKHNADTLYEITTLVYEASELYNIYYVTSLNDTINVNTVNDDNAGDYVDTDTISIDSLFFENKFVNLNVELTYLNNILTTCDFEEQVIYVNGVSVYTFNQYDNNLIPDLNLTVGDTVYIEFIGAPRECTLYWGIRSSIMIIEGPDEVNNLQSRELDFKYTKTNEFISFDSFFTEASILDLNGRVIANKQNVKELNIENLNGIYILKLMNNNKCYTAKINF